MMLLNNELNRMSSHVITKNLQSIRSESRLEDFYAWNLDIVNVTFASSMRLGDQMIYLHSATRRLHFPEW